MDYKFIYIYDIDLHSRGLAPISDVDPEGDADAALLGDVDAVRLWWLADGVGVGVATVGGVVCTATTFDSRYMVTPLTDTPDRTANVIAWEVEMVKTAFEEAPVNWP